MSLANPKSALTATLCMALALAACTSSDDSGKKCPDGEVLTQDDRCLAYYQRYEPAQRIDADNVRGESPFKGGLEPGPAPNSGFRLILPSQRLEPFEETTFCWVWKMPQEIQRQYIYTMSIQSTVGLHHGNMMSLPQRDSNPRTAGLNPSQSCDIFSNLDLGGVPQGLFGSSTQVVGQESYSFPDGFAIRWLPNRDATISVHMLNPTDEAIWVDVVYDFYTTGKEDIVQEVVPVFLDSREFTIPPNADHKLVTECEFKNGGAFVALLPHMHERGTRFTVEAIDGPGGEGEMLLDDQDYDIESDIYLFDQPPTLDGKWGLRWTCEWSNDLDQELHYGIGNHEMCTLFGYMYPPFSQTIADITTESSMVQSGIEKAGFCQSIYLGELAYDYGSYNDDTVGANEDRQE